MGGNMNISMGKCVFSDGVRDANLVIRNGKIEKITDPSVAMPACGNMIQAEGCLVFPGMIDSHVHIRGGAFSYREDFYTGSIAAATAGITTIFEMPGCAEPAFNAQNFLKRVKEVHRDGAVNFGLYGAAGYDNLDQIEELARCGAIGYKTFQMAPVAGREKEFYGMCAQTREDMIAIMNEVRKTGRTLTVHCESQEMIDELVPVMKQRYGGKLEGFIASRPPEAEAASVALTVEAAKQTGCRTIIAHVSCPQSMEIIDASRKEGFDIHAETCAHYLYFDKDQMYPYGVFGRMKPPFRSRNEVDRMVEHYHQGDIEITGSDHAPYTRQEKLRNGDDVWNSFDGLYGLEMTLPLLLNLMDEGKITAQDIARNFSMRTAEIFHVPSKGKICEGYDADLVIVKKNEKPVPHRHEDMHCKCRDAAVIYDGIPMKYSVEKTILAGREIFDGSRTLAEKGSAKIIHIDDKEAS